MVTQLCKFGARISLILEMISDAILVVSLPKHITLAMKICGVEVQNQMSQANLCLFQYHLIDNKTLLQESAFGIIMSLNYLNSCLIGDQLLEELKSNSLDLVSCLSITMILIIEEIQCVIGVLWEKEWQTLHLLQQHIAKVPLAQSW